MSNAHTLNLHVTMVFSTLGQHLTHMVESATGFTDPESKLNPGTLSAARRDASSVAEIVKLTTELTAQNPTSYIQLFVYSHRIRLALMKTPELLPSNIYIIPQSGLFATPEIQEYLNAIAEKEKVALLQDIIPEPQPVMTVATDASLHNARNGGGTYAWITSRGDYAYGSVDPKLKDIESCELYAILDMLNRVNMKRGMRVLVDSKPALRIIRAKDNNTAASATAITLAKQIRVKLAERPNITLEWVKAHNGNPLNDGADRLARNARMANCAGGADEETTRNIARNIRAEALESFAAQADQKVLVAA